MAQHVAPLLGRGGDHRESPRARQGTPEVVLDVVHLDGDGSTGEPRPDLSRRVEAGGAIGQLYRAPVGEGQSDGHRGDRVVTPRGRKPKPMARFARGNWQSAIRNWTDRE